VEETVEETVEYNPHVETIQVVLEAALLKATDQAARRLKINRSAFIRQAVAAHLRTLRARELEESDRRGYERVGDLGDDLEAWDRVTAWPED
jgi:hypothetical protein